MAVQALLEDPQAPAAAAEKLFEEVTASLLSSHLEVVVAGLQAATHAPAPSLSQDADAAPETQWVLQKCRCLLKLTSSTLPVHLTIHLNIKPFDSKSLQPPSPALQLCMRWLSNRELASSVILSTRLTDVAMLPVHGSR